MLSAIPVVGGLLESVLGIITGTIYGIAPQLGALLGGLPIPGPV